MPSAMTLGPQDLLSAIVNTLRCIRGRESHLLPKLLRHSEEHIGSTKLGWGMDTQLSMSLHFPTRPEPVPCEELTPLGVFDVFCLQQSDIPDGSWDFNRTNIDSTMGGMGAADYPELHTRNPLG